MKPIKSLLVLAATALLSSVSAVAGTAEIDGYCPVAYVALNKAVKGSEEYSASHGGKTYYLGNAEALQAFKSSPEKFIPQYSGYCAYGVSLGKKFEVDPTVFKVVDGKIYLNKNAKVGKLFAKNTKAHIKKADAQWLVLGKEEMMKEEMMKKEEMLKEKLKN